MSGENPLFENSMVADVAKLFFVATLCSHAGALAQENEEPRFRVGGLAFGDLYTVPSNHTEAGEGATGAVLRRGYLTFDADFTEKWFGRLRFEVNQSGEFETYDFETDFKDAYVGREFGRHRALLGLSPTPTFDLIESFWGLRYLVRTPMDLQGVASRDTGLSAQGPLNASGTLNYRVMVGAGLEFGAETGAGAKWMGALEWNPAPRWTVDFYLDHERLPGRTDRNTVQVFAGYKADSWRWAVEYSNQNRQDDPTLELASAFVIATLTDRWTVVGRVDRLMQPSPAGDNISYIPFDPAAKATFFVGGFEYRVNEHLMLTPNTLFTVYDESDEGVRPRNDWYLRLTLFLKFE